MIKVLQVLGGTNLGGAESRIMDLYRHMDKDRIQFDFLVTEGNSGYYTPEIETLGGTVYTVPKYKIYNHIKYVKALKAFFKSHNDYAVVHGHMTSTAAIYLPIAKKSGIQLTIAHARSAGVDSGVKGIVTTFLRRNLSKKCDKMMACSDLAAKSVFGNNNYNDGKVKVLPNAIDVRDFAYDAKLRDEIRKQYDVEDKLVIGHVGRFHEAKNHRFIIKVFAQYLDFRKDAVLMLVGEGGLRPQIESWIEEIDKNQLAKGKDSIKDKIIFTGNQSPVAPYYHAFDFFLFPSIFEGMPGTVVEAQASGLNSLISDAITRMVKVTDKVMFMSLLKSEQEWASMINSIVGNRSLAELVKHRENDNSIEVAILLDSDYNVDKQIEYYVSLYENKYRDNK